MGHMEFRLVHPMPAQPAKEDDSDPSTREEHPNASTLSSAVAGLKCDRLHAPGSYALGTMNHTTRGKTGRRLLHRVLGNCVFPS